MRHGAWRNFTAVFWATLAACGVVALGQPPAPAQPPATKTPQPPQEPAGAKPAPDGTVRVDDLAPPIRLGVRAALLREQIPVLPVVVIVPDERSYVEAIARWTPGWRYPVLIEDGTLPGLEDIARFVRGFKPTSVVRWSFKPETGEPWPRDAAARRELVERAVARSWDTKAESTRAELQAHWKKLGVVPPGIVIANIDDPAWTAALALAAGHAQPIGWVNARIAISDAFKPDEGEAFAAAVEAQLQATGLAWNKLGDDLDAASLCLNCPVKIELPVGTPLPFVKGQLSKVYDVCALTDRIGRLPAQGPVARWGWSSQIFGSPRQSAYRAMCALFLESRSAWLFDGFPDHQPWNNWDCTRAGEFLRKAGFETTVDDSPKGGRSDWRARAGKPLDAGLALINTKGECTFFELEPGVGRPGDTPLLSRPVAVHMVHSWSLQYPAGRDTVGGRWLDNGAFCYFGSVQEPFLGAFLPTPEIAARLASAFAWCAACRQETHPLWRLACIGDPLYVATQSLHRGDAATLGLVGTQGLREQLAEAMKSAAPSDKPDAFAPALRLLAMLGDDEKAAQLVAALLREKPALVGPDTAAAAMFSLARRQRADLLAQAFARLEDKAAKDPYLRDALWVGSMSALATTTDKLLLQQLRKNPRDDQADRDALDLSTPYQRVYSRAAALEMLEEARAAAKTDKQKSELDKAMAGLR